MKTTLFYFSATGNSLHMTRMLSHELGNCEIVSIATAIQQESIITKTPVVGIVFPVYAWGLPRMVTEFVNKLSLPGNPYVFAMATCVAIPGNTLAVLQQALREKGNDLHAGFTVSSGRSSLMKLNTLDKIIIALDRKRKRIKNGESRLAEMADIIRKGGHHGVETSSRIANLFGALFHGLAVNSFASIDSTFEITDSCMGCGNCVKRCPRTNIILENGRPVFQHNCELCHACIQWCPNFAIKHPNFDASLKQYHHPAIQMKDLILR